MSYMLSLQGGMASGKTTTARYVTEHLPGVAVSFENPAPVLEKIKAAGWNKHVLRDFLNIQRLFIAAEVERYDRCKGSGGVIFDLGPEEIEFYTLHFPRSIGMNWEVELLLAEELKELRRCRVDGILFLDSAPETLRQRKEADGTRSRNFFHHYLTQLHQEKRKWFSNSPVTTFLNVEGKSPEEVGQAAVRWVKSFMF